MKITIHKPIGRCQYVFEVEGEKDIDVLFDAGLVGAIPDKCGHCDSNEVRLTSNKAQGYKFVKVSCDKCGYVSQLGQLKEGGFFWKEWQKPFIPKDDVPGIGKDDIREEDLSDEEINKIFNK